MGFQTPVGSTATQLGATLPDTLTGTRSTSPAVPPYPTDERWWNADRDGDHRLDLDARPADAARHDAHADARTRCRRRTTARVFLPGHYTAPVTISSGNVYFASGVYYFENDLTHHAATRT